MQYFIWEILPGVGEPEILHLSLMLAPSETVKVGLSSDTLGPVAARQENKFWIEAYEEPKWNQFSWINLGLDALKTGLTFM